MFYEVVLESFWTVLAMTVSFDKNTYDTEDSKDYGVSLPLGVVLSKCIQFVHVVM